MTVVHTHQDTGAVSIVQGKTVGAQDIAVRGCHTRRVARSNTRSYASIALKSIIVIICVLVRRSIPTTVGANRGVALLFISRQKTLRNSAERPTIRRV